MAKSVRMLMTTSSVVFAITLALQIGAAADTPLQWWRHTDFTFRSPGASAVCGFDVFVHIEGEGRATVFYDKSGAIVREVDSAPNTKITVFAPSTGKSFTWAYGSPLYQYYTDGAAVGSSVIAIVTGVDQRYPGSGVNAGRTVYEAVVAEIDPSGVPIIAFLGEIWEAGPDLETSVAVARCDAVK